MSLAAELHNAHKARQRRIAMAADRHKRNTAAKADAALFAKLNAVEEVAEPVARREYETPRRPSSDAFTGHRIIAAIAAEYNISIAELTGRRVKAHYCQARFVVVGILLEMTNMSLPAIGRRLGNRDHTTIIHARKRAQKLFASEAFRNRVDQIKAGLMA